MTMEKIDPAKVFQQRIALSLGMDKYAVIMNTVRNTDVAADTTFQRTFNGFYMVRRDSQWQSHYYALFEKAKSASVSFEDILYRLHELTGQVEASFASKMLATLNPDMPIWDQYVIKNLGVKLPSQNDPDRLRKTVEIYTSICTWYNDFLDTDNALECVSKFDEMLPDYAWVSRVKKIDFFLWSIR